MNVHYCARVVLPVKVLLLAMSQIIFLKIMS